MTEQIRQYFNNSRIRDALHIPVSAQLDISQLGQGEYNANYVFRHPVSGQKLVFRINTGSQMHLEQQITYEAGALEQLKHSGRTPQLYYVDDSKQYMQYGVLVMEFLEGRSLRYEEDMELAAAILADIHSVVPDKGHSFVRPDNPLAAMHEECIQMAEVYLRRAQADKEKKACLKRLLNRAEALIPGAGQAGEHILNTELNAGNFLINGPGRPNYLIDWEKPLLGRVEQDLGHFLAPTTTFWKTDCILTRKEVEVFLQQYRMAVQGRFDLEGMEQHTEAYLVMTCLRGLTWCAMAYVEYQSPDRPLKNESTYCKIQQYMEMEFLKKIETEYFTR